VPAFGDSDFGDSDFGSGGTSHLAGWPSWKGRSDSTKPESSPKYNKMKSKKKGKVMSPEPEPPY